MSRIDRRRRSARSATVIVPVLAVLAVFAVLAASPRGAFADVVALEPAKDNTLFDNETTSGGGGASLFSGRTGDNPDVPITQRAVVEWDVAGNVPAGSTITSVSLQVLLTAASPFGSPETHTLHRILAEWGEGTSNAMGGQGAPATPNDATWLHTYFPGSFWSTAGGDFEPAASGSTTIGTVSGFYSWSSSSGMVADVQAWLDDASGNHGWMIRGDEDNLFTSRKLASREWGELSQRPILTIEFDPPSGSCADVDGDDDVDFQDLLIVLAAWSPDPGSCPGCSADIDGDDDVDFQDLLLVLAGWGTCP